MNGRYERSWKAVCWRCGDELEACAGIQDGGMCVPCFQKAFSAFLEAVSVSKEIRENRATILEAKVGKRP